MDVDIARILERTKRCAMTGRKRAEERGNHNVKQQMEEIEALLDILETKLKEKDEKSEAGTEEMAD
tara:strand:+ start:647 stop:844 length:198 start_codon:yes stop_codon:yes gene_type:complete